MPGLGPRRKWGAPFRSCLLRVELQPPLPYSCACQADTWMNDSWVQLNFHPDAGSSGRGSREGTCQAPSLPAPTLDPLKPVSFVASAAHSCDQQQWLAPSPGQESGLQFEHFNQMVSNAFRPTSQCFLLHAVTNDLVHKLIPAGQAGWQSPSPTLCCDAFLFRILKGPHH